MNETKVRYDVQFTFTDIYDALGELTLNSKRKIQLVVFGLSLLLISFVTRTVDSLGIWAVFIGASPVYIGLALRMAAKRALQSPIFSTPKEIVLDHDGVTTTSYGAHSNMDWNLFLKWKETSDAFVLYMTPQTIMILPKRCIPNQHHAVRELLSANVQNGARLAWKIKDHLFLVFSAAFLAVSLVLFFISLMPNKH